MNVITHNLTAMNANRQLSISTDNKSEAAEKLSSGYRINRSADDAAGLSISEKMRSQIRGLNKASDNIMDGVSLCQIADGALNETHDILHRMTELATQAANDTNTTTDRKAIKSEIDQLAVEIDRIANNTQFNSMNLLDGSFIDKKLQVGALNGQTIGVDFKVIDSHSLGLTFPFNSTQNLSDLDKMLAQNQYSFDYLDKDDETSIAYNGWGIHDVAHPNQKGQYNPEQSLYVDSNANAARSMKLLQNATELVSEYRSGIGALQNRLEYAARIDDNIAENTQAGESRIRDVDMAEEMVNFSKHNILEQVGQSMLAQANQSSQSVVNLLQ